jgi:nucleotide-binding universal stress UspA family protein
VRVARTGAAPPATSGPVRLFVGHNGSKACDAVIHEIARRCWPENTEAHVISVVDTTSPQRTAQENCVNRLRDTGLTVRRRFIDGDPRQALLRESERCNADAIFLAPPLSARNGRFLLGSVATALVTRARSTVEVVRQN